MSDTFDPYHKWLGIRPEDQPPNHYRLLGIATFEHDLDVIEASADGRMSHLRAYQMGQRADLCQRLLNEVSTARTCLMDPQRRAAYDYHLQQAAMAAQPAPPTAPPVAAPATAPAPTQPVRTAPAASPGIARSRRRKRSKQVSAWPAIALIAIALAVAALFIAVMMLTEA